MPKQVKKLWQTPELKVLTPVSGAQATSRQTPTGDGGTDPFPKYFNES